MESLQAPMEDIALYLHHWRHPEAYTVDPVSIGFIFAITFMVGWLGEFFWPKAKLRPLSSFGAWLGLAQAVFYSGLSFYVSYQVLVGGQIRCLRKLRCGGSFIEDEGWVSIGVHPLSFWTTYLYLFLLTVVFVAWFFVCVRAAKLHRAR